MGKNSIKTDTSIKNSVPLAWIRRVMTLFIFYHLSALLVSQNSDHYLADRLRPSFMPYWQLFEFGSEWNFFAPEPGPAPLFLKYEIYDSAGILSSTDQMPHYPDDFFFRDRQIRRLNIVRYLMRDDQKIYSLFVPWICRTHPEADYIKIKKIMFKLPSVLEIQSKSRSFYDEQDAQEWTLGEISCDGRRT